MRIKTTSNGFTLIELLVVMSITAILIMIGLPAIKGARSAARDAQRKADLEQIRGSLEMYRYDNNDYPAVDGFDNLMNTLKDYVASPPNEPLATYQYSYKRIAVSKSFTLCAHLETVGGDGCNYGVTSPGLVFNTNNCGTCVK